LENNKSEEIKKILLNSLKSAFQGKIDDICVCENRDEPHVTVSIEFEVYRYFILRLTYDRGSLVCAIVNGKYGIVLNSTEKWFDNADMSKFFNDIRDEVEMRIPDKYLVKNNWK